MRVDGLRVLYGLRYADVTATDKNAPLVALVVALAATLAPLLAMAVAVLAGARLCAPLRTLTQDAVTLDTGASALAFPPLRMCRPLAALAAHDGVCRSHYFLPVMAFTI